MRNWNHGSNNPDEGWESGIQPTYEELKPNFVAAYFSRPVCIQPTYEELKRNGNSRAGYDISLYPAYLWGIETRDGASSAKYRRAYPAYLWGIET